MNNYKAAYTRAYTTYDDIPHQQHTVVARQRTVLSQLRIRIDETANTYNTFNILRTNDTQPEMQ